MAKTDPKILIGTALVAVILLIVLTQYQKPSEEPAEGPTPEEARMEQALQAEGILVQSLDIVDSTDVEASFGITLNDGRAAVILFESKYESLSGGAAGEYAKAITKAFEVDGEISYAFALATNVVGRISKKPVLGWADRALAEEIKGKDLISAYNNLNLTNLEIAASAENPEEN